MKILYLLQQVSDTLAANELGLSVKLQLRELAEARRVVVASRFGVSETLQ